MEKGLSNLFNLPSEWAAFPELGQAFGDGWLGVDLLPLLEAITPAFKAYQDLTQPTHFKHISGDDAVRAPYDFYMLPRGITRGGTMGYRIIRTGLHGAIGVLDIDRVLDNAELYGKSPGRPHEFDAARNLRDSVSQVPLERLHHMLKGQARWVQDYRFLIQGAPDYFQYLDDAREIAITQMMAAIDEVVSLSDGKQLLLKGYLVDGLVAHDAKTALKSAQLLQAARAQLKPAAVALMAQQPATQTHRHYRFLSRRPNSAAYKYPILLLADNFEQEIKDVEKNEYAKHLGAYLQTLREEHIGAHNAKKLPILMQAWALVDFQPKDIATWDKIVALHTASKIFAPVLDAHESWVFDGFIDALKAQDQHPILDHLMDKNFAVIRAKDTRDWNNYFSSLLALRLYTDMQTNGHDMPLSHALHASGFNTPALNEAMKNVPYTLRKKLHRFGFRNVGGLFNRFKMDDYIQIIETAYAYTLQRKDEDAPIADMTVSNRLMEHGASYSWGALPDVYLSEDGHFITAITTQDALLKSALRYNHDLWKHAVEAITGQSHFLDITGERGSVATAHVREPEHIGGQWEIVDIAHHARGHGHNATAALIEQYFAQPEFMAQYNPQALQNIRSGLIKRMAEQAKSNEYLGINHKVHAERVQYLRAFTKFLPADIDGFGMSAAGCIASPSIDKAVEHMISQFGPIYKGKGQKPAYKVK